MEKKCTVIINPTSGHGVNDKLAGEIGKILIENGAIYKRKFNILFSKFCFEPSIK